MTLRNNFLKYELNITQDNPFTYSDLHLGNVVITSGAPGDGETYLTTWGLDATDCGVTDAENSQICRAVTNLTGLAERNITIATGLSLYWRESQGSFTVNYTIAAQQCTASTCSRQLGNGSYLI